MQVGDAGRGAGEVPQGSHAGLGAGRGPRTEGAGFFLGAGIIVKDGRDDALIVRASWMAVAHVPGVCTILCLLPGSWNTVPLLLGMS